MFDYLIGTALLRAVFGPDFETEVFQRRLGLACFVLLSLLATGLGFFRGLLLEAELAELAADGATAQGAIVAKNDGWNRNASYYDFAVEYTTPDEVRHRKTLSTDGKEYKAKRVGDPVTVRYVRSKPDTFYMVGREPTESESKPMRYFLIGGLASLVVITMWSGSGGGRAAPQPAKPSPRSSSSPRPASPGPDARPVFGKRG